MHVCILGPVSPNPLAAYFDTASREKAVRVEGDYGQAPTALARALLDQGNTVTVVTHRRGHAPLRLSGPSLTFIQVDSRRTAKQQALTWWHDERIAMTASVLEAHPDIVHCHWTYEWALAGLQTHLPLVVSIRDAPLTILRYHRDPYRLLRTSLAYFVRERGRSDLFIANSPYMASAWRHQMLWFKRIPVIPNIVPIDIGGQDVQRSIVPLIVEIADSGRRKNVSGLLRAFKIVRQQLPASTLELIGSGLGAEDHLAQWAVRHQLAEGVSFRGKLDRAGVSEALCRAWVHVHASREESFGLTLSESMALGTPVIGGRSSGAVPWVVGPHSGLLTDVCDPKRFAHDILRVLSDKGLQADFSAAGLRNIRERFAPSTIARQHIEIYKLVLEQRSK